MKHKITPQLLWMPVIFYWIIAILAGESEEAGVETSLIENLEVIFWMAGFISYTILIKKRHAVLQQIRWHILMSAICFLSLGEETSWGQHWLGYETPGFILSINDQKEFNVHNTDLSKVFKISQDSKYRKYLYNGAVLLNPLFYGLCIFIWLLFPLCLDYFKIKNKFPVLLSYPYQTSEFYWIFFILSIISLYVDIFWFNAGELFELTLASAGAITGLSLLFDHNSSVLSRGISKP